MSLELVITNIGDTWVNSNRTGADYSRNMGTRLKSGSRFTYLLPELPNIAGATVLDAYLVIRGAEALVAQTITVKPITEEWAPGRVRYNDQPSRGAGVATAISATAADMPVELTGLGLMLQAVADGTDWYGFRLETSTATDQRLRAVDSGLPAWELHIEISDVPDVPDNLRPDGGGAVDTSSLVLAWETFDYGDEDDSGQAALWVQIDTPAGGADPDDVSPDFDSATDDPAAVGGWVPSVDPQYDTTGKHTFVGVGPHYWRVNVKDADGNPSGWSDWADFTDGALPTLIMDSPTGPFGDPSPNILARLSSGTLSHWKARITGPDRSDVRIRSGLQAGPIDWDVPLRHKGRRVLEENPDGGPAGWLNLRVWVEGDRAVAVGQPGFIEQWIALEFDDDLGLVAPTSLVVVQAAPGDPRQIWTWSCAELPDDGFAAYVDGVSVARLDVDDLEVSGGIYTWRDSGEVQPLRPHTLAIRALDGNQRSAPVEVTEHRHVVEGVWLLPDDGEPMRFAGKAVEAEDRENAARYQPQVGPPVDVIYDPDPGLLAAFTGTVDDREGDVWETLDRFNALKRSRSRRSRMVWGAHTVYGSVAALGAVSSANILPRYPEHDVRFEMVESG